MKTRNTLNIGIFAHVDAGKTTITENLLFESGAIDKIGRVDDGNTQTDQMGVERRRGISVKATATSIDWKDLRINIIDTPGHGDFIAEVQRSMLPLDGAVLVVSAREGVQPHTLLLFDTIRTLKLPAIIFINKIDRPGADPEGVIGELQEKLSRGILPVQQIGRQGDAWVSRPSLCYDRDGIIDGISAVSDEFTQKYLSGDIRTEEDLARELIGYSRKGLIYPVLAGSALKNLGVDHLLENLGVFLPVNRGEEQPAGGEASAIVFKITRDKGHPKQVYLRLYKGSIAVRQVIGNERVTSIFIIERGQMVPAGALYAGDIGIVTGLNSLRIGDIIGSGERKNPLASLHPTLRVRIIPRCLSDLSRLASAVSDIAECDPFMNYELDRIDNELYVSLFGNVQKEILREMLETQYGIETEYREESLIYRETVAGTGEFTLKMLTDQNPWPATVGIRVEPNDTGGGVVYRSLVSAESLPRKFQHSIEEGVKSCLGQGVLGWELDDIVISLVCGKFITGTIPTDFKDAAPMAFMEAVFRAGVRLLWPVNRFELKVPGPLVGRALGDLSRMKARFNNPVEERGFSRITGEVPAELSRNYDLTVLSYTGGKGYYTAQLDSYGKAPGNVRSAKKKINVDPLNRGRYLLFKKRSL